MPNFDMEYLPFRSETLVLPYDASELQARLTKVIRPVRNKYQQKTGEDVDSSDHLFNGVFENDEFTISRIIKQPENFLPLITGKIEATSVGCILFLKYRMFFSTNLFLGFWSVVTFLMTLLFVIGYNNYLYATVCFGFGVVNYSIAVANFNIQVRQSKKLLNKVLN